MRTRRVLTNTAGSAHLRGVNCGTIPRLSANGSPAHVLFAAVLFGTTGTAQALGPELEPVAVGASRIAVGAALLARRRCSAPAVAGARLSARAVLLAGACVAVYQATFFAAVADTGVAVGDGRGARLGARLHRACSRARSPASGSHWRWAAATALACAGVALLVLGGGADGDGRRPAASALALVSGAGYAGYAVAGKRMLDTGGAPEGVMAAVFGTGAVLLLPVLAIVPAGGLTSARRRWRSPSTSAPCRPRSPISCSRAASSGSGGRGRHADARGAAHGRRARRDRAGRAARPGGRRPEPRSCSAAWCCWRCAPAAGARDAAPVPAASAWLEARGRSRAARPGLDGRRARRRVAHPHPRRGSWPPGSGCLERELTERYGVARHSVRAALRSLAAEGLVALEPHRGASVARLDDAERRAASSSCAPRSSWRPRTWRSSATAGASRTACARRSRELGRVCARAAIRPGATSSEAHNEVHLALVRAAGSERIARAYDGLAGEMRLFLMAIRPQWSLARMSAQHEQLLEELERVGPAALREHLEAGRGVRPARDNLTAWPLVGCRATWPSQRSPRVRQRGPAAPRPSRGGRASPSARRSRSTCAATSTRIGGRDVDAMAEHWSEDGVGDLVPLGILRGREEITASSASCSRRCRTWRRRSRASSPAETRRRSSGGSAGTSTGEPFQGVEPTGRRSSVRGVDLIEVEDGKNVSNTAYYDGMAFARQVGLMPAAGLRRRAGHEERLQRRHASAPGVDGRAMQLASDGRLRPA